MVFIVVIHRMDKKDKQDRQKWHYWNFNLTFHVSSDLQLSQFLRCFFYRLCLFLVTQWDWYVNLILQRVITWRRKTKESKFVLLSSKCAPKFFVQPLVYVFPGAATGCWAESCLLIETNKLRVHHSQGFEMAPNFTQESVRIDNGISLQHWHNLSAEWVQYFCTFFSICLWAEVIVQ